MSTHYFQRCPAPFSDPRRCPVPGLEPSCSCVS